jgi:hypothetical protein
MKLSSGKRELELNGRYLSLLAEATPPLGDVGALRRRLEEEGYLLLRGLHDPEKVRGARRVILENLAANGQVDTARPLMDGAIAHHGPRGHPGAFLGGAKAVTHSPAFLALVEAPELMGFFHGFLGAPPRTPPCTPRSTT